MLFKKLSKSLVGLVVSGTMLIGFLLLTRPSESNLGISFAPLVFLWALIYFLGGLVADIALRQKRVGVVRALRVIGASSVTLLVMFNALGDVSVLDGIILLALAGLGSFYFSRTWRS